MLMQGESEYMEFPGQQYKPNMKLSADESQKLCGNLKEFGETLQMRSSKGTITFSVQGDSGTGFGMSKSREAEKPGEYETAVPIHEQTH